MAKTRTGKTVLPRRRSLLTTLALLGIAVVGLAGVGTGLAYALHRPTFDKIAGTAGSLQRGLVVACWSDVAHHVVTAAALPADEGAEAHKTVDRVAESLRERRGTPEQAQAVEAVARRFIETYDAGTVAPDAVRTLVKDAGTSLAPPATPSEAPAPPPPAPPPAAPATPPAGPTNG